MAHHCIKYRLNADGTIPGFLCLHPEGVGGAYAVGDPNTSSPRDMVMIGLSESDDVGDAEIVPTKADLQNYLASVSADWVGEDMFSPFDSEKAANWVWARKDALNGV